MSWQDYLNELDRAAAEVEAIERAEEEAWWESLYDTMRPTDDI